MLMEWASKVEKMMREWASKVYTFHEMCGHYDEKTYIHMHTILFDRGENAEGMGKQDGENAEGMGKQGDMHERKQKGKGENAKQKGRQEATTTTTVAASTTTLCTQPNCLGPINTTCHNLEPTSEPISVGCG
eukprot:g54199.t1